MVARCVFTGLPQREHPLKSQYIPRVSKSARTYAALNQQPDFIYPFQGPFQMGTLNLTLAKFQATQHTRHQSVRQWLYLFRFLGARSGKTQAGINK